MISSKAAFSELEQFLSRYDPITLLSQLALTYLFVPAGEFQDESGDTAHWERRIEFVAGYLLVRPLPKEKLLELDGAVLEELGRLLDQYYNALSIEMVSNAVVSGGSSPEDVILRNAKVYAMYVRGEAYPQQLDQLAIDLYSPHDAWFRTHLGFTIGDAKTLASVITEEYEERNHKSKEKAREYAKGKTDELINAGHVKKSDRARMELAIACDLHFGNAKETLAFSLQALAECSGLSSAVCEAFLQRMSQPFDYQNPKFTDTFVDADAAPWDYNTLKERPLINCDGKYWLPLFPALREALFNTFYFDLMADATYRPTFEDARGKMLERLTAEYLKRVFPADGVLLNPHKSNGEELSDVLVLHDGKIVIVQCKSKPLTRPARIGADLHALKVDLRKAIQLAFDQGIGARTYLRSTARPEITVGNRVLAIDMSKVSEIYILNVTLTPFQMLTTRLANWSSTLEMFPAGEYPWSVAVGDLDVLTQLLNSPAYFLHYASRRLALEHTTFELSADEMDLAGFYIAQGMYFDSPQFDSIDGLSIVGLSSTVDRWMFDRQETGAVSEPPRPPMPPGFEQIVADIESSEAMFRTNCVMALLDLSGNARASFVKTVNQAKEKTRADGSPHSFSAVVGKNRGISFLALDSGNDRDRVFQAVASFAILKKYQEKAEEWIGLAWDLRSEKAIDVAFYVACPWTPDEAVEREVQRQLRRGTDISS